MKNLLHRRAQMSATTALYFDREHRVTVNIHHYYKPK